MDNMTKKYENLEGMAEADCKAHIPDLASSNHLDQRMKVLEQNLHFLKKEFDDRETVRHTIIKMLDTQK
jgi:hypothetical protein